MLIRHDREKLIQAINYFVRNTHKCGKTKLFKLLYFLDFEHFKRTGRSVTGLDYFAWPMGPVPIVLHEEIAEPQTDMARIVRFEDRPIRGGRQTMLAVHPQLPFEGKHFSRRELRIMKDLANEYHDAEADDMVEATHLENKPWDKIYNQQGRKQALIPYELAVRPDEVPGVMKIAKDREELRGKARMNVGSVFFDEEFQFHDGESGEKLFVVLGTIAGVSVVVKTTSRQHGRGNTFGCQIGDRFPSFFLPPRTCYLKKASWVCLDEFYELRTADVLRKAFGGIIKPVCTLVDSLMRQIQDCALLSDDITAAQEAIVGACLVQVTPTP